MYYHNLDYIYSLRIRSSCMACLIQGGFVGYQMVRRLPERFSGTN